MHGMLLRKPTYTLIPDPYTETAPRRASRDVIHRDRGIRLRLPHLVYSSRRLSLPPAIHFSYLPRLCLRHNLYRSQLAEPGEYSFQCPLCMT